MSSSVERKISLRSEQKSEELSFLSSAYGGGSLADLVSSRSSDDIFVMSIDGTERMSISVVIDRYAYGQDRLDESVGVHQGCGFWKDNT